MYHYKNEIGGKMQTLSRKYIKIFIVNIYIYNLTQTPYGQTLYSEWSLIYKA